jgi:hypothetical protein
VPTPGLHNRLVAFGTQFFEILFSQKNSDKIVGVIGGISFDSQEIFYHQNAIEGQFLPKKSCFPLLLAIFDHFSWK